MARKILKIDEQREMIIITTKNRLCIFEGHQIFQNYKNERQHQILLKMLIINNNINYIIYVVTQ